MKKFISIFLSMALILGLTSTSFAFTKAPDINKEAVDVMMATEIIKGYPDGNFHGDRPVTRAEMAKMISVADNYGEDIGDMYKSSCKFADSKNHWGAGYIAYCASEGIISGRSDDVFDPDATVTGTEAAKMMLITLGYDAKTEKFTGSNWEANVLKLAKSNKLFDKMTKDFVADKPLNRENAAQLIFNGLQAGLVYYTFDFEVSSNNFDISIVSKPYSLSTAFYEWHFLWLYKKDGQADEFGRPAHKWEYDGDLIGTYTNDSDYEYVVAEKNEVLKTVKGFNENLYDKFKNNELAITKVFINGVESEITTSIPAGSKVELYETNKNEYVIVVINYDIVKVAEVDKDVKSSDKKKDVTAYVTLVNEGTGIEQVYKNTEIPNFNYQQDDVIAVSFTTGNKIIGDTFIANKVNGTVDKTYKSKNVDYVVVDGKTYTVAKSAPIDKETIAAGNTYDLYMVNGFVYGSTLTKEVSTETYGLFLAKDSKTEFGKTTNYVKVFTQEGKEVVYTLEKDYSTDLTETKLISYTVNSDGEIDSITPSNKTVTDKKMTKNGILDGKIVNANVIVFNKDNDKHEIYGYDELSKADSITCDYLTNEKGDIAAVYTTIDKSTSAIGFYFGKNFDAEYADKDGKYTSRNYYVDGLEKEYFTTTKFRNDAELTDAVGELQKITFDVNGKIIKVEKPTVEGSTITDKFRTGDYVTTGEFEVTEVKGNAINLGSGLEYVGGANVYMFDEEGNIVKTTTSKIKKGSKVVLYQLSEKSEAWDAVVITK